MQSEERLALMTLFLGVITVCRFVFGSIGRGADMLQDYVSLEVLGLRDICLLRYEGGG